MPDKQERENTMAHFYAEMKGARGATSRLGTKQSGIATSTASYQGCIHTTIEHNATTGKDVVTVRMTPWHGAGTEKLLYRGDIDGRDQP